MIYSTVTWLVCVYVCAQWRERLGEAAAGDDSLGKMIIFRVRWGRGQRSRLGVCWLKVCVSGHVRVDSLSFPLWQICVCCVYDFWSWCLIWSLLLSRTCTSKPDSCWTPTALILITTSESASSFAINEPDQHPLVSEEATLTGDRSVYHHENNQSIIRVVFHAESAVLCDTELNVFWFFGASKHTIWWSFAFFWHFIDQTINRFLAKDNDRSSLPCINNAESALFCVCDWTPVHAIQSNSLLLFSALLLMDPAHMGRAEKGESRAASRELSFLAHSHHHLCLSCLHC